MVIEYCVGWDCQAKRLLGGDQLKAGTDALVERLRIRRMLHSADGYDWSAESRGLLEGYADELDVLAADCHACRGRARAEAFGCMGRIGLPVTAQAEQTLLGTVQGASPLQAYLIQRHLKDYQVSGRLVQRLRQEGLFERQTDTSMVIQSGAGRPACVRADQILEMVLPLRQFVSPDVCLRILLWLGILRIGSRVPQQVGDMPRISALEQLEPGHGRLGATALQRLPCGEDAGSAEMVVLMRAYYVCWACGIPLLVYR